MQCLDEAGNMLRTNIELDADLYPVYASHQKATYPVVMWIVTAASYDNLGEDGTKWT